MHSEYNRRIQNADMLETHIIQARLQAAAKEEHDHNRIMEEVGEAYRQLGLPPGRFLYLCLFKQPIIFTIHSVSVS